MGWQDAPLLETGGTGKAAWEMAPLVEDTPEVQGFQRQTLPQAFNSTIQGITQPLPTRTPMESDWWTENLPQSISRLPVSIPVGMGKMAYNAAKKFTDPIVNAWTGEQDLGSAAKDFFYAPGEAGTEIFNQLAHGMSAPLGLDGKEAFKQAWSDPGASALAVAPVGAAAFKGAKALIPQPTEASLTNQLGRVVKQGFDKGIKPKGVAKTRNMLLEEQRLQQEAITSIVKGKDYLKFKDEFGDVTQGRVPKNLDELSQAITQRKLAAIEEANAMNLAAGEMGVEIPLSGVLKKLQEIIDNPVLQDNSPAAVRYAQKKMEQFAERGTYTPAEAQEAMAIFNQSEAIAKANPTKVTVSTAQIDSLVANNLRQELNAAVERATGPGYSAKRKEFGALKSIEEPVNSRLKKFNQQNTASALNFYDVFSASDLLQGAITGSPASAAKGIGLGWISQKIKMGKDPNRAVDKMFRKAEGIVPRLQKLISEREASSIVAEIAPQMQQQLQLPPPERGFTMRNPEDVYSPYSAQSAYSPELAGRLNQKGLPFENRLGLPMPERGFSMRNPEDVYAPYSPEFAASVPNRKALPPGTPPETFRPATTFDRLFQIAQSPEGKRLLLERLGREEKYSKILEELMAVPEVPLLEYQPSRDMNQVRTYHLNQLEPNKVQEYKVQPSGHVRKLNALGQ